MLPIDQKQEVILLSHESYLLDREWSRLWNRSHTPLYLGLSAFSTAVTLKFYMRDTTWFEVWSPIAFAIIGLICVGYYWSVIKVLRENEDRRHTIRVRFHEMGLALYPSPTKLTDVKVYTDDEWKNGFSPFEDQNYSGNSLNHA